MLFSQARSFCLPLNVRCICIDRPSIPSALCNDFEVKMVLKENNLQPRHAFMTFAAFLSLNHAFSNCCPVPDSFSPTQTE